MYSDFGLYVYVYFLNSQLKINALIKRGTLHQHQGNADKREEDFNKAIEIDENNPDIYHHLGQVN